MLSQSPSIYILLSGMLGAIISGIMLLTSIYFNNKFQWEREKQQHIWQEESEQQKWYREKIYDSYRICIQIVTKIMQEQSEIEFNKIIGNKVSEDKGLTQSKLFVEFYSEFNIILAGYPNKESKEFKEKILDEIDQSLEKNPWIVRGTVVKMMEQDSRIKNMNK